MPTYKIAGCDVLFPHQAYGVQLAFQSKVIGALEAGNNALLEAPTGGGDRRALPPRCAQPECGTVHRDALRR